MTARILPPNPPREKRADVIARLSKAWPDAVLPAAYVVWVRGYYAASMGPTARNDRGLYDDAAFVIGPNGQFQPFNANADPGSVRIGQGKGAKKGMARLKPGVWSAWTFGIHRHGTPGEHRALVQRAAPVTVIRDGKPDYEDTGWFGINMHRGGNTRTNSEGCLTIPPTQWLGFLRAVEEAQQAAFGKDKWDQTPVTAVLVEGAG